MDQNTFRLGRVGLTANMLGSITKYTKMADKESLYAPVKNMEFTAFGSSSIA